jgi:mRNA-degrading endonuclease RelE of RelBE toxin-antitoxin system
MTHYTVEWRPEAIDDLTDIWSVAPDRRAITLADRVIERLLYRSPQQVGQHVAEGLYKLHEPPLLVFYEIDDNKSFVYVTNAYFQPY